MQSLPCGDIRRAYRRCLASAIRALGRCNRLSWCTMSLHTRSNFRRRPRYRVSRSHRGYKVHHRWLRGCSHRAQSQSGHPLSPIGCNMDFHCTKAPNLRWRYSPANKLSPYIPLFSVQALCHRQMANRDAPIGSNRASRVLEYAHLPLHNNMLRCRWLPLRASPRYR